MHDDLVVVRGGATFVTVPTAEIRLYDRHERIRLLRAPARPFRLGGRSRIDVGRDLACRDGVVKRATDELAVFDRHLDSKPRPSSRHIVNDRPAHARRA